MPKPSAKNGFLAVIVGTIYETILQFFLNNAFAESVVPAALIGAMQAVMSLAGLIVFIHVVRYWNFGYIIGAIFAYIICFMAGLTSLLEGGLFVFVLVLVLFLRWAIPPLRKLIPIDIGF